MQYKIPIQIENEDAIIFGLSLRQLGIILVGFTIAYTLFQKLETSFVESKMPLYIICGIILLVFGMIAIFNNHEMTFFPFMLNFIRLKINGSGRYWKRGIDSFSAVEIGYVQGYSGKTPTKKRTKKRRVEDDFQTNISQL